MAFRTVSLDELTIDDETSLRSVALYGRLKQALRRSAYRFSVPAPGATASWDRVLFLNLTYWGGPLAGDILCEDHIPGDVVAHVAWHHLANRQLAARGGAGPTPRTTAAVLLFAESIASAFESVPGRPAAGDGARVRLHHDAGSDHGGVRRDRRGGAAAFEALMQEVSREPERAFEDMRALLLDVVTALLPCADAAHAEQALDGFAGHRFEPLLHHFQLSNWILYMRAHAGPPSPADAAVAELDATLRAAPIALDWLADHWLAPDEASVPRQVPRQQCGTRLREGVRALAMAILLDVQQLTASFGARPLFQGINFTVDEKERIGLIGPNGAGQVDAAAHPGRDRFRRRRHDRAAPRPARGAAGADAAVRGRRSPCGTRSLEGIGAGADDDEAHEQLRRVLATLALETAAAPAPTRRSRRCRAGGRSGSRLAAPSPAAPICCCSTSRPTTSTSTASSGWRRCSGRGAAFATITVTHDRLFLQRVTTRILELDRRNAGGLLSVAGDYATYVAREGGDDARAGAARGGPAQHAAPRDRVAAPRPRGAHDQAAGAHPARRDAGRRGRGARDAATRRGPRRWSSGPRRRGPSG